MASHNSSAKTIKKDPLGIEHHIYQPAKVQHLWERIAEKPGIKTQHKTTIMSEALTRIAQSGKWNDACEEALTTGLPVEHHHRATVTHCIYVQIIGLIVARCIKEFEEGNVALLKDRLYVRDLMGHDLSKTSKVELAAYSGIMAIFMERNNIREGVTSSAHNPGLESDQDVQKLTTRLSEIGLSEHYRKNKHHLEHHEKTTHLELRVVVEIIVEGLACILETSDQHTDKYSWLKMFTMERFQHPNKSTALRAMDAISTKLTDEDYNRLMILKSLLSDLLGDTLPWGYIRGLQSAARGPNAAR